MTLEDSIHTHRLRVSRDAERLGNVSEACRRHGLSRTMFYRLRKRFVQYGAGFVECLQKTILHEHRRIAFRRQYVAV